MTPEQQKKQKLKHVIQHAAAQMANMLPEETGPCATAHTGAGNVPVIYRQNTSMTKWIKPSLTPTPLADTQEHPTRSWTVCPTGTRGTQTTHTSEPWQCPSNVIR